MKILVTGDWHVGTECDGDLKTAVESIIDQARTIKPDLIVLPGDIYDGKSEPDHRNLASSLIQKLAAIADVVIVKGNHDERKDLLILGSLKAEHSITVYESPGFRTYPYPIPVTCHYLPWMTKAAWIAGNAGKDAGIQAGNESVSLLALHFLRIQVSKCSSGINLLFSHLMVSGAKAENHQPLLGEGITLGYHDLVEAGFDAGAFGHIHLAQPFGDRDQGSPEFRYAGAPVALNYGESSKNKSFCVLDTETLAFTLYPLQSIPRINLNAFWNGRLNWTAQEPGLPTEAGARVKVKLLIEEGYSADEAEEAVRQSPLIVSPLELKIERQRKPRDMVRAQEIAAAQDACQKLIAYWNATNTTPEEPMRSDMLAITKEAEAECAVN
jgi:DNA repair exonuclease SbcCD nuclease subunit